MTGSRRSFLATTALAVVLLSSGTGHARGAMAHEIDTRVDLALERLMRESETARAIAERAVGVLVFPDIVKAGFGFGGQFGEGALRRGGVTEGYYNITAASFGLQIGAQSFSQVLFFMTEEALGYLQRVEGFEIGGNVNVTVIDEGVAVDAGSTTLQDPIAAFAFGQRGLMAGVTIEGSKISRIHPD